MAPQNLLLNKTMTTLDKRDLGHIEELNSGGEGTVYRVTSKQESVYKEFKSTVRTELDVSSLKHLIELPNKLNESDKIFLFEHSVWPQAIVTENNSFVGFVMPIIHESFFVTHGVRAYPGFSDCDWNKLIMRKSWVNNPNIVSTVPQLEGIDLLDLLIDLCESFAFLHRNNVIAGDISGRNMVWRARPTPRAILLDNDGFRIKGSRGVTRPKQSPDWIDPHLNGSDTTTESDKYKLGLAVLRGYFGLGVIQPDSKELAAISDPIGNEIIDKARQSLAAQGRPSADEWVQLLRKVRRKLSLAGRTLIPVTPPVIDPNRTTGRTLIAKRPIIKLQ